MSPSHGFEIDTSEKLGRIESKLDSLVGNGQPGRMTLAENRLSKIEKDMTAKTAVSHFVTGLLSAVISTAATLATLWSKLHK